ncbi:MAG: DUF4886 domain-containing protein [Bacteroidales bacterium]
MKFTKSFCIIFSLLIFSLKVFSQPIDTVKVLFIGNSFTFANDLPLTFSQLATKAGKRVLVDNSTFGGYTLEMHFQNATTIQKIYSQKWDYVVLQEQSQIPSFIPDRETMMYPFAVSLDSVIHDNSPCSRTLFFMTWAHKFGDQGLPVGSDTYEDMQQRLRSGYMTIADSLNAAVAPCGWAWRQLRQNYPNLELYSGDNYHPNENGTYLAACTFYASIFTQSAVGINYTGNVLASDALVFQSTASQIVLDSLALWNIGLYNPNPTANFGYIQNGNVFQFTDSSVLATDYKWNFGDGNSSILQNPTHVYTSSGTYQVRLIAANDCDADTIVKNIQFYATGIENTENLTISISPNPSKGVFDVKIPENIQVNAYEVMNVEGKVLITKQLNSSFANKIASLDLSKLPSNVYFLKIYTAMKPLVFRLVKN